MADIPATAISDTNIHEPGVLKRVGRTAAHILSTPLGAIGCLLANSFEDLGIGLYRGSFNGGKNAGVWVLQVGCRGC